MGLRPAKSMFSLGGSGGFGRHVGDLMSMPVGRRKGKEKKEEKKEIVVKKEEVTKKEDKPPALELASSEVFEIRGDEVFEMG
jgi:hypothetical protein